METRRFIWMLLLSGSLWVCDVRGAPIGTSSIDCEGWSHHNVGTVDEGYSGEVEILSNPAGKAVTLDGSLTQLQFLELSIVGTNVIISTKKPLDADELKDTDGILYYSVVCVDNNVYNSRTLRINDLNDNAPIFEQKLYNKTISESQGVNTEVLRVTAVDADASSPNNRVSYSILLPASPDFEVDSSDGAFLLKKPLNYNMVKNYNYTVEARDIGGLLGTATVLIEVEDYDRNPYFSYSLYQASIREDHTGPLPDVLPEAIKAQDGDTEINVPVVYSISSVSPSKYLSNFNINQNTGVISVVTTLDREETDMVTVNIKAAQTDDSLKTADAVVSVTVEDVNDNAPSFSQAEYNVEVLESTSVGTTLVTLTATDPDEGSNSLITYSFSSGSSPLLTLDGDTGVVTLASDLSSVPEDTVLNLTAMAQDNGQPSLHSTARVLFFLSLGKGVAFESSYNFSIPENEPIGTVVGVVKASSGSPLYEVTYNLTTHTDLFSVDALGALTSRETLDMETLELYFLKVEAVDNRIPPTSAVTLVWVTVLDVNEPPVFSSETYQTKIFSIAPHKHPVVQVQASDPDRGQSGQLQYTLVEPSQYFGVERSSGQVYVVSAAVLAGEKTAVVVKATDPEGLHATTRVEVEVQGSASSDVVVMFLNRTIDIVEEKVREMEQCLGQALNWTVQVIGLSSMDDDINNTYVSLIFTDNGKVIPGEEVKKKLQSEGSAVKAGLETVFGPGLEYGVVEGPVDPGSNPVHIALGVILPLLVVSIIGLTVVIRRRRSMSQPDAKSERRNSMDIPKILMVRGDEKKVIGVDQRGV